MKHKPSSSAGKKAFRGMGQRLKAYVRIGKVGLGDSVSAEIEMASNKNRRIKIRFEKDRPEVQDDGDHITQSLSCEYVESVGRVALFFRDIPEEAGSPVSLN